MAADEREHATAPAAAVDASRAMFAGDRASLGLGIEIVGVAVGAATVQLTVRDDMLNGHGSCHGGYIFFLADTAFSLACNTHGVVTVAAAAEITFTAPVRAGERLQAHATERTRFGRRGIFDVTVRRADGAVVAEFCGHSHATSQPLA